MTSVVMFGSEEDEFEISFVSNEFGQYYLLSNMDGEVIVVEKEIFLDAIKAVLECEE